MNYTYFTKDAKTPKATTIVETYHISEVSNLPEVSIFHTILITVVSVRDEGSPEQCVIFLPLLSQFHEYHLKYHQKLETRAAQNFVDL